MPIALLGRVRREQFDAHSRRLFFGLGRVVVALSDDDPGGEWNRTLLLRGQRARATRELDLAYENLRRFEDNDPRASDSGQELGARPRLTRSSMAERRRRGAASYTIGPANSVVYLAKRLKASTSTTKMWRRLSSTAPCPAAGRTPG
jgi:hypothetical protein